MVRAWWICGAVAGLVGVAAGAFGAHGLKDRLSAEMMAVFQVAARYEMYHALALLGVAWLVDRTGSKLAGAAGYCFVAGIVLFSGSLYVLAISGIRAFGAITPLGGLSMLIGWILLAAAGFAIRPQVVPPASSKTRRDASA